MPEVDIEKQVEKYWEIFVRQLSDQGKEDLDKLLEEIEEQFIDPTRNSPVKTVDFAKWLDPEPVLDLLKTAYPYFRYIKERLGPRMRFFAYFMLSRKKNLWQAYNSLSEDDFIKLGFQSKPYYELLREFAYERIGIERFPLVLKWIVRELKFHLQEKGIPLGKKTFQDATTVRSLKHDKEAKYSGFYKHAGYKIDYTIDADLEIPLHYVPMEITGDEGENLIPSQQHLFSIGIKEEERVVDPKYATYANISYSESNGVSLYYKITGNWVYNEDGDVGEIKRRYQKYHKSEDFVVGADLDFMIRYLYKKGEYKVIGAYFRNMRMAEYEEHPEGYEEIVRERGSRMEGNIGRVKLTTLLEDHPGRRGWKQFLLRAGMVMLSLAFAALIRVQNGVFEHLTNLTYIT